MKIFKKVLTLAVIGSLFYLGYTIYKTIINLIKLQKNLPLYLENITKEKPDISVSYKPKCLEVSACFSQKTLSQHTDLEQTIVKYISDFYANFPEHIISVEIIDKEKCHEGNEHPECNHK
jgi:hypothetical protein